MKPKILAMLTAVALTASNLSSQAAEPSPTAKELREVITKVQAKLKDGKPTEADLAPEIKAFDDLLAKHKGEKSDEVAQVLLMKAMLKMVNTAVG